MGSTSGLNCGTHIYTHTHVFNYSIRVDAKIIANVNRMPKLYFFLAVPMFMRKLYNFHSLQSHTSREEDINRRELIRWGIRFIKIISILSAQAWRSVFTPAGPSTVAGGHHLSAFHDDSPCALFSTKLLKSMFQEWMCARASKTTDYNWTSVHKQY